MSSRSHPLPVLPPPPQTERADAARNRRRILDVAERLFAERGVAATTMDDIAAAAAVGKGTLYRRFGDRAGLGEALLDERERAIQDAILAGPPPLGPGADPRVRLHAFLDAFLDYLERDLELIVMSETARPGARYRSGVHAAWRMHVASLLTAIDGSRTDDVQLTAELLLAPLAGDLQDFLRHDRGVDGERIRAAIHRFADAAIE